MPAGDHINWKKQLTLPNLLSLLRLIAVPFMAREILGYPERRIAAVIFFVAIWLTDVLDGWIARRFNQVSEIGKVLDPLVDKIFQITTAVMLTLIGRLPVWVPLFLIVRELIMVVGSALLYTRRRIVVHSRWYGRLTTVLLVISFALALILPDSQAHLIPGFFVAPLLLSVFALVSYIRHYRDAGERHA
ncbi:MAG: CDP-alcohol phosphatidyltransferase family protein [Bacillota bacterium]|nr:CDP-alcohol phosphatidyltransferase family protein [Bacillota bacterium]